MSEEYEDEELEEEEKEKLEAATSAALSKIMAKSGKKEAEWEFVCSVDGYDFYKGYCSSTTIFKSPRTYRGKIKTYDAYIKATIEGKTVDVRQIEYVSGFMPDLRNLCQEMVSEWKAL